MTRTIKFYLQNLEKRQKMIKSLTTLKTENSRLKKMILFKSKQIEEMNLQLQAVQEAKQNLFDLLTKLFNKVEEIKEIRTMIEHELQNQQQKIKEMKNQVEEIMKSKEKIEQENNMSII